MPINIDNRFLRDAYPADKIDARNPTNQYQGKIATLASSYAKHLLVREVDGAVVVESVDDRTRQEALSYLTNCEKNATQQRNERQKLSNYHLIEICGGVGIIGAGIAVGTLVSGGLIAAVAAVAAGILATSDGAIRYSKEKEAIYDLNSDINIWKQRRQEWNDPLPEVIANRKSVVDGGFMQVFNKNYKNNVVHPEEVKRLWTDAFRHLLTFHEDIDQVYNDNLLGDTAISYAFGNDPLADIAIPATIMSQDALRNVRRQYAGWRESYKSAAEERTAELRLISNHQQKITSEIHGQRELWFLPAQRMYRLGLQEAESLYANSLRPYLQEKEYALSQARNLYSYEVRNPCDQDELAHKRHLDQLLENSIARINREFNENPDVRAIEDDYSNDQRMCRFLLEHSECTVNAFFERQLQQLNREVDSANSVINRQYQTIKRELAEQLHQIFKQQPSKTTPALTFHRNYVLSSFKDEPSWDKIYGNSPYYEARFSSHISRRAWDLFWGHEGIGGYASLPAHSWNNLFTDRFPLRGQWFHLHSSRRMPRVGLFVQPIIVPEFRRKEPVKPVHSSPQTAFTLKTQQEERKKEEPQVPSESRTAIGFGSTKPRYSTSQTALTSKTQQEPKKEEPQTSSGSRTAIGFGSTKPRYSTSQTALKTQQEEPKKEEPQTSSESRTAIGFGSTKRR